MEKIPWENEFQIWEKMLDVPVPNNFEFISLLM